MRQKKLILSAALLLSLGITSLRAQQAIPATGGDVSGSGGTVSYSIGQVVYTTNTGTGGSGAQGVQQPYEIFVYTGIEEAKGIECTAYPNPATDHIIVKVFNLNIKDLKYQLFEGNGKLIENKVPDGNETFISMEHLVPATYFLKVLKNNKEIKSFKIIKNK
jgi:hypothetical protein